MNDYRKINKNKLIIKTIKLIFLFTTLCCLLTLLEYEGFKVNIINFNLHRNINLILNGILYNFTMILISFILCKRKLEPEEIVFVLMLSFIPYLCILFINNLYLNILIEFLIIILYGITLNKDKFYKILIECIVIYLILLLYKISSLYYRNINLNLLYTNLYVTLLFSLDFYILLILLIYDNFKRHRYLYYRIYSYYYIFLTKIKNKTINKITIKQCLINCKKILKNVFILIKFTIIGIICYFINKTSIEYCIIIISFFSLRKVLGKYYCMKNVFIQSILYLFIFIILTKLNIPLYISITINVLIGLLASMLMYILYYYDKYIAFQNLSIKRGMNREELLEKCTACNLTPIETEIMILFYCDNIKIYKIAYKFGYSEANISKIKENILKKFKALDLI